MQLTVNSHSNEEKQNVEFISQSSGSTKPVIENPEVDNSVGNFHQYQHASENGQKDLNIQVVYYH